MSPCKECSKLIHQSGIKRVVFINKYKDSTGIEFLKKAQVEITHFDKNKLN
jgi:dCMP deaminase